MDFDFDTVRRVAAVSILLFSPVITAFVLTISMRLRRIERKLGITDSDKS